MQLYSGKIIFFCTARAEHRLKHSTQAVVHGLSTVLKSVLKPECSVLKRKKRSGGTSVPPPPPIGKELLNEEVVCLFEDCRRSPCGNRRRNEYYLCAGGRIYLNAGGTRFAGLNMDDLGFLVVAAVFAPAFLFVGVSAFVIENCSPLCEVVAVEIEFRVAAGAGVPVTGSVVAPGVSVIMSEFRKNNVLGLFGERRVLEHCGVSDKAVLFTFRRGYEGVNSRCDFGFDVGIVLFAYSGCGADIALAVGGTSPLVGGRAPFVNMGYGELAGNIGYIVVRGNVIVALEDLPSSICVPVMTTFFTVWPGSSPEFSVPAMPLTV